MLVKHHDGDIYRVLFDAFDVQTQRPTVVYMALEGGALFVRDKEIFDHKFTVLGDPQENIKPKPSKQKTIEQQLELFGSLCPGCGEEDCLGGCAHG